MAKERTIRSLLVRLGVVVDKQAVTDFNGQLEKTKGLMGGLLKGAAAMLAGLAALATGTWLAVSASTDHAEAIKQQAAALGITTAEFQELRHVFDQFPSGADGVTQVLNKVNLSLADLRNGSTTAAEGWSKLNIKAKDMQGLGLPAQLERLAEGFATTTDKQKRLVALNRIFGDDLAAKVAPALEGGAEGIRALRMEARRLALVLDDETLNSLNRVKGQMQAVRGVIGNLAYRFGAMLAPSIDIATESFLRWYEANSDWIKLKFDQGERVIRDVFTAIAYVFADADTWVRDTIGGWEVAFTQFGKAVVAIGLPAIFAGIAIAVIAAGTAMAPVILGLGAPFFIVSGIILGMAAAFGLLLIAGEDVYQFLNGGDSVFGRYLTWLGLNYDALVTLRGAWDALKAAGWAAWDLFGALLGGVVKLGNALGAEGTILEWFTNLWWGFARGFGGAVLGTIRLVTKGVELLTEKFGELAEMVSEMSSGGVANAFGVFGKKIGEGFGKTGDLFDVRGGDKRRGLDAAFGALGAGISNASGRLTGSTSTSVTTVGDINVTVGGSNATPEDIAAAMETKLSDKLKNAGYVARGGDR